MKIYKLKKDIRLDFNDKAFCYKQGDLFREQIDSPPNQRTRRYFHPIDGRLPPIQGDDSIMQYLEDR